MWEFPVHAVRIAFSFRIIFFFREVVNLIFRVQCEWFILIS